MLRPGAIKRFGSILAVFFFMFPFHALQAEMIHIPAGPFFMGEPSGPDAPLKEVTLDAFFIDPVEVTNRAFQTLFTTHSYPSGAGEHPASLVTWEEAKAYCERLDKRLPSEAEWEKAARGTDGRIYPWGDKVLRTGAHPSISGMIKRKAGFNKKDRSPYGVLEMASSVWEWTAGENGAEKIARGGLWNLHLDYEYSTAFDRITIAPERRYIFLGFRCAR
jgi:formylglycine-generating enzyme required for sulfatase activity